MKTKAILPVLILALVVLFNEAKAKDDKNKARPKIGLAMGNSAPEIMEKNADGEVIKLSQLRGRMILIDFWASWCGPCRRENPNVVENYHQFKDKKFINGRGFTVYSVSLDHSKGAWLKAIKDDKLSWPYHVSDLKGWNAKYAAVYNVRGIPANVLIDGNGVIVGRNLRGDALKTTLKQLLK